MKAEILSAGSTDNQSIEEIEMLLRLCLTRSKLLLLERSIGDFDLLKQTLQGCFVRVLVQGRPMLAIIQSVEDQCQIEWARFERRLFLPSLGYFEFDQVHPEMPGRDEIERWCQRRKQIALGSISNEFIETKLARLKMHFSVENRPAQLSETMAHQHEQQESGIETTSFSADEPICHVEEKADSDQFNELDFYPQMKMDLGEEEEEEVHEANSFYATTKADEMPELPNVDGLVQSRELLAQVLLPCDELLKCFSVPVNSKMISRATAGCLMAFRISGKMEKSEVIVDEIVRVTKNCAQTSEVHFKFGLTVDISQLIGVEESEITDQVFDQWLERLTIRNESLPDILDKYSKKIFAINFLVKEANLTLQLGSIGKLPDIAPILVTSGQVRRLADNFELADLCRVLTGCFLIFKMDKFTLNMRKQPMMCTVFVVPITRVGQSPGMKGITGRPETLLYFDSRIPIRHRKTGEQLNGIGLQDVWYQKIYGTNRLVLRNLLMMAELNIPLPSDEEIARKSSELEDALAKAIARNNQKEQQQCPLISKRVEILHSLPPPHHPLQPVSEQTAESNTELSIQPLIATIVSSSSLASATTPQPFFNQNGPNIDINGEEIHQKRQRITPEDAGH